VVATGLPFNDAYRYVDWLLTVPLLLMELILVYFTFFLLFQILGVLLHCVLASFR
jgi:bacteriorhodopsin